MDLREREIGKLPQLTLVKKGFPEEGYVARFEEYKE